MHTQPHQSGLEFAFCKHQLEESSDWKIGSNASNLMDPFDEIKGVLGASDMGFGQIFQLTTGTIPLTVNDEFCR